MADVLIRRPDGYVSKSEAADRLGISEKTLERRIKGGEMRAKLLLAGRRVWLLASDVEAYFTLCRQRGYV